MKKETIRQAAELHPSLILQPYDALMWLSGFDVLYSLCENVGGATVYIPTARTMFAGCLNREALREYDGYNADRLAKKYGFSHRHMRRMLSES